MEEKKINREPLEGEELSDVNGGYCSVPGSVMPTLEKAVMSGSYAAAKESAGVQVAAMSEADAIRQNVPVMHNYFAGHKPQQNSGGESYGKWSDDL